MEGARIDEVMLGSTSYKGREKSPLRTRHDRDLKHPIFELQDQKSTILTRKSSVGTQKSILRKKQSIPSTVKGYPISDENIEPSEHLNFTEKIELVPF